MSCESLNPASNRPVTSRCTHHKGQTLSWWARPSSNTVSRSRQSLTSARRAEPNHPFTAPEQRCAGAIVFITERHFMSSPMDTPQPGSQEHEGAYRQQEGPYFGKYGGRWMPESLMAALQEVDRKSTRLNSSHVAISYAVC